VEKVTGVTASRVERLARQFADMRPAVAIIGGPPLAPTLPLLLDSLEHEADLRPIGRLLMRIHLRDLLETRP